MAPTKTIRNLEVYLTAFYLNFAAAFCSSFTITNNCQQTIWPATLAGAGTPQLSTTGFQLDPGQTVNLPTSLGWSGRIWARTECKFDKTGAGKCQTGDCGGKLECSGMAAEPPTTLFEITFGKESSDYDFYDVSLVDGFNLPLVATPIEVASNSCATTGCAADLNHGCPKELEMVGDGNCSDRVVACKSACEVFGLDQYCCIGEFGNPTTCKPSFYSTIFKTACPRAYSYAFDDGSSTFTCKANNYHITFCPATDGLRRSNGLSTREPVQEYSNTGRPERPVSWGYASIVPFHSFVILTLIFLL